MDRIRVQIQFRKACWTCPKCRKEDITDLNMAGGNVYEHNCSACGTWFNKFRDYSGSLSYQKTEYDALKANDITIAKSIKCAEWLDGVKNPPPVVEPTKEQLELQKADLQQQVNEIQARIDAKNIAGN